MPSPDPRPRLDFLRWVPVVLPAFLLAVTASCSDTAPSGNAGESELLQQITRPGDGGSVHLVRLIQSGDRYAFEPSQISIPSGDVVRFVMVGSQPESVVFDAGGLSTEAAEFVRRGELDRGILLTESGAAYDVTFRDAPPGHYPFRSLPHSESGMRGIVIVRD